MRRNITEIKQKTIPILRRHEVKRAALFGSCVRSEMREDSDIDILVEIKKNISLLDFVDLKSKMKK